MPKINKYITALALGFNSGLVYALLGSTLTAYLDDNRISLVLVGFLSLRMMPYSFKPAWSPFVDNLRIKLFRKNFGQRKAWLIASQIVIILCMMLLGLVNVQQHLNIFFYITLLIAFMGATSDIALQGYRIELFEEGSEHKGNSYVVLGFRIGLFISGSFALYLAAIYAWKVIFFLMGLFLIPSLLVISLSIDKRIVKEERSTLRFKFWIKENFIKAIGTLLKLDKIIYIVFLLGFYKVSDAFIDTMLLPFLTQVGFLKADIANTKLIGIITGIIGTFAGVKIISKVGMIWSLLSAEILSAITNLLFLFLIYFEQNKMLLYVVNGIESFCGGIANIVLISYMSSMCTNKKFTASHFAWLNAFSIIFRILLSSASGWAVVEMGWSQFFIISALLSLPSVLCIYFIFFRNKKYLA